MYLFTCKEQSCFDMLSSILGDLGNYEFAFDLTFFDGGILTVSVSRYIETQRNCFESARTSSLGNKKYEIELIPNANFCRLDLTKDQSVSVRGVLNA